MRRNLSVRRNATKVSAQPSGLSARMLVYFSFAENAPLLSEAWGTSGAFNRAQRVLS